MSKTLKMDSDLLLNKFWESFYKCVLGGSKQSPSKRIQYNDEVFKILESANDNHLNNLHNIQMLIEGKTMLFDEQSIFKTTPNIMKMLIRKDRSCAKDYLKEHLHANPVDIELISEFGPYTIEALIVHVLSIVFHSGSIIRVASLVEQLDSSVRQQSSLLKSNRCKTRFSSVKDNVLNVGTDRKRSKLQRMYRIGSLLLEFMDERELISLFTDLNCTDRVQNKKGSYYIPTRLFAICNFSIELLPIKLNLPMVCPPLDWTSACPGGDKIPQTLSDLSGGYLTSPSGYIYDRYRLLTTTNMNNFHINIGCHDYKNLCSVMNKLQGQAFQINTDFLNFIQRNEQAFVDEGYLMPPFLSDIHMKGIIPILRECFMNDKQINKLFSFSKLLDILCKDIQRARSETLILRLAQAYKNYQFYLPAFLDFRGRIYRCGLLNFHERDLARSLVIFAPSRSNLIMTQEIQKRFVLATSFHYKSFVTFNDAFNWFNENLDMILDEPIKYAKDCKHPFQFVSHIIGLANNSVHSINNYPLTQDASASAYQIMSYFLLDETMAKRTNLIPSLDGEIKDIYSFLLEEVKEFMKGELEKNLFTIVCSRLTRTLVKSIFMPMIYGKTIMSTACDLKDHLSHHITNKECFDVASVCFKFWRTKSHGMDSLIRLIRNIGWIVSARGSSVLYSVPNFTTVQDYMKMEAIKIWIYDRVHKKRRRVTFRVSTSKGDSRKTEISTFVNFIHQMDAHIAMSVIEQLIVNHQDAPIYTVHDNFITTAPYCENIPFYYSNVIREMGPPLSILNKFIYMNVIKPLHGKSYIPTEYEIANMVISKEDLSSYLMFHVPENISKRMMETWESRISGILTSYENYTRNVCEKYHQTCWEAHDAKWIKFKSKIIKLDNHPNYSVHY